MWGKYQLVVIVSPIAEFIVLVTRCLNPYCLRFACILFSKEWVHSGAIPTSNSWKPLAIYDSFESYSLNSIYLIPGGASSYLIFIQPFNSFCNGSSYKRSIWGWLNLPSLLYVNYNLAPWKRRTRLCSLVACLVLYVVLTEAVAHSWWEYLDLSTSYDLCSCKSLSWIDLYTFWIKWFAASFSGNLFQYNLYVDGLIFLEVQSQKNVKFYDTKVRDSFTSSGFIQSSLYGYKEMVCVKG